MFGYKEIPKSVKSLIKIWIIYEKYVRTDLLSLKNLWMAFNLEEIASWTWICKKLSWLISVIENVMFKFCTEMPQSKYNITALLTAEIYIIKKHKTLLKNFESCTPTMSGFKQKRIKLVCCDIYCSKTTVYPFWIQLIWLQACYKFVL